MACDKCVINGKDGKNGNEKENKCFIRSLVDGSLRCIRKVVAGLGESANEYVSHFPLIHNLLMENAGIGFLSLTDSLAELSADDVNGFVV